MNANFTALGAAALNRTGGTVTGALTSSGGSLAGTWTGTPTISTVWTFSGVPVFSGATSFTGAPVFSGAASFTSTPVFSGAGTVTGSLTFDSDAVHIFDTNASHDLIITPGSDLTADRVLTLTTGDAARTLTLTGNATLNQDVSSTGSPTFSVLTITSCVGCVSFSAKTTSFSVDTTGAFFYSCDATGGTVTATLPAAATAGAARTYTMKKIDASANSCTFARAGADTIDAGTTLTNTIRWDSYTIASDGVSAWYVQ